MANAIPFQHHKLRLRGFFLVIFFSGILII
jgi:hypothetical protein